MNIRTLSIAAVALLALSACDNSNKGPEELTTVAPDPQAAAIANRAPIELPPAIKADVSMRCNPGNSLAFVTFFEGDKMAVVKTKKDGPATKLTAPTAGEALTAEGGWSLKGTPKLATLVTPDGTLTCKG